jgi:hypothetical protein
MRADPSTITEDHMAQKPQPQTMSRQQLEQLSMDASTREFAKRRQDVDAARAATSAGTPAIASADVDKIYAARRQQAQQAGASQA